MKKQLIACTATVALSAVLSLGLIGCGSQSDTSSNTKKEEKTEQVEKKADEGTSTNWKDAKTAEEAAKGAGFELFGVPESLEIDDLTFKEPTFSYADGVARAAYETGACGLYIHKADGTHKAPLSDRDTDEFASTWTKEYEGLEVNLYGQAKGAATVMTWKDGSQEFGVTNQGLGGEEMSMDSDVCESVVKAIHEANAKQEETTQENSNTQSSTTSNADANGYIGEDEAKKIAAGQVGGVNNAQEITCELKVGGDAPHYNVTVNTGSATYLYEIDAYTGAIWSINEVTGNASTTSESTTSSAAATSEADQSKNPYSKDQAIALFESASGGKASSAELIQTDNIGWCWQVSGTDASGTPCQALVDGSGNVLF